jgi:hypothetical protein
MRVPASECLERGCVRRELWQSTGEEQHRKAKNLMQSQQSRCKSSKLVQRILDRIATEKKSDGLRKHPVAASAFASTSSITNFRSQASSAAGSAAAGSHTLGRTNYLPCSIVRRL